MDRYGHAVGGINGFYRRQWTMFGMVLLTLFLVAPPSIHSGEVKHGGTLRFGTENEFAGFEVLKSGSRLAINDPLPPIRSWSHFFGWGLMIH